MHPTFTRILDKLERGHPCEGLRTGDGCSWYTCDICNTYTVSETSSHDLLMRHEPMWRVFRRRGLWNAQSYCDDCSATLGNF